MIHKNDILTTVTPTWLEEMDFVSSSATRKTDDVLEYQFWQSIAPIYSKDYNLNNHTHLIVEKILSLLEPNQRVLEIGGGSGNFTIHLAPRCESIYSIDLSLDMIQAMHVNLDQHGISNVFPCWGKFEDIDAESTFDYVISINSLYRIQDISTALQKIYDLGRKGFILVRTLQRSPFFQMYADLQMHYQGCQDYKLLPLELWNLGIHANVEYVEYKQKKSFHQLEDVYSKIISDIGVDAYTTHKKAIHQYIETHIEKGSDTLLWNTSCAAVFIYYIKR